MSWVNKVQRPACRSWVQNAHWHPATGTAAQLPMFTGWASMA